MFRKEPARLLGLIAALVTLAAQVLLDDWDVQAFLFAAVPLIAAELTRTQVSPVDSRR